MAWTFDIASVLNRRRSLALFFTSLLAIVCLHVMPRVALSEDLSKRITAIETPGLKKEDGVVLAKNLGLFVNGRIDESRLDEQIRTQFSKGRYDSLFVYVSDSVEGLRVTIKALRLKRVKTVRFVNVDSDVLEEVRSRINWEDGPGLDPRIFEMVKDRLKVAYENRGYFNAQVELKSQDVAGSDESEVEISVNPGAPTLVDRIVVTAGDKSEEESMRDSVTFRRGEPYNRAAVEESVEKINRYLQTNQYSTSRVEDWSLSFSPDRKKVDVTFLVKLGDRFQFQFIGNTVFDEFDLRSLLTDELLSQTNATSRIVEVVESKYRAAGFHFVQVKVNTQQRSVDEKRSITVYRFEIDEGKKVLVDKIHFTGGLGGVSEEELAEIFTNAAVGVLKRRVYWEEGLRDSVREFKDALERLGYLSTSISPPRSAFSDDRKGVELFFDVELGTRTLIKQILITGNTYFNDEKVRSILGLKEGDPFDRIKVREKKEELVRSYQREGFVDMKYAQEIEKNEGIELSRDLKEATIRLDIIEGGRFFVGSITIEGNRKTKPEVILREMKLKEGDVLNPELATKSEEDINTLGLFSRVELVQSPNANHKDRRDIKVIVRENRPGLGEVGLGGFYEDPRFRVRSFIGVTYRNLFGHNQTGSTRLEISVPFSRQKSFIPFLEYSGLLGYRSPYPFGLPFTFVSQLTFDSFEVANVNNVSTIQSRTKFESRIEKKFSQHLTGLYRLYQLERTKLEVLDQSSSSTAVIGSTGPGVILDFRDDVYNPTKGSLHSLNLEVASPLLLSENLSFVMAIARNSFYVPLVAGIGVSFYAGGGYAQTLFPGVSLPATRLANDLALGGRGSIRGFSVRRFSPLLDPKNPNTEKTMFYNARGELTIPLFANFSGAIFLDTGQIFPNFRPDNRHDGVGLGIRYKTPIGPVVVDIAQGLGADREELKFYFTVGTL